MKIKVTSLFQSNKLLELGIPDSYASMSWYQVKMYDGNNFYWTDWKLFIGLLFFSDTIRSIPAFTAQDLLQILPEKIDNSILSITKKDNLYICEYVPLQNGETCGRLQGLSFKGDLIECLYKLVCSYKMLDEL